MSQDEVKVAAPNPPPSRYDSLPSAPSIAGSAGHGDGGSSNNSLPYPNNPFGEYPYDSDLHGFVEHFRSLVATEFDQNLATHSDHSDEYHPTTYQDLHLHGTGPNGIGGQRDHEFDEM